MRGFRLPKSLGETCPLMKVSLGPKYSDFAADPLSGILDLPRRSAAFGSVRRVDPRPGFTVCGNPEKYQINAKVLTCRLIRL